MKRAKISVDFEMDSYEEIMVVLQCHSCIGVPEPYYNLRYKCYNEGHSLCRGCKKTKTTCPCGSLVSPKHCRVIQALMKGLPWSCRYFKHGCREMFKVEIALTDHQIECIYRQIKCCFPPCDKEISIKDYLDHHSTCQPDLVQPPWLSKGCIEFAINMSPKDGFYYPDRFELDGRTFFFIAFLNDDLLRMYMLMLLTSSEDLKHHEWNLKIIGAGKEEFTFRGEPLAINKPFKDILKGQIDFSIRRKKALEIQEKMGKFVVFVEIRNLKEEAK